MAQITEAEYYQQVAAELQQGFANTLASQAANYEGQLAMLKVQHKMEVDSLKEQLGEHTHEDEAPEVVEEPAPKQARKR